MKKIVLISLFFCFSMQFIVAQTETGVWTSLSIDKRIKKWQFSADTDIRTYGGDNVYYFGLIDRWSIGVNAKYQIIKPLEVSLNYLIMNKLDTKYANYQWRHRVIPTIQAKQKWGDLQFSLRERIQFTTKDDSKRIRPDGSIDHYAVNSEFIWRNRFQIQYDIPQSKVNPAVSVESFYELNNPKGNQFQTIRYTLAFNYQVNKQNSVEIFNHFDYQPNDLSIEKYGIYILGISYRYSLK
ncbi:MAG: DUF2490 domain-containing protein [Paludibacter sp.]|nr:DUF2490 domain-containing protein [Paludibacter sp.]